MKITVKTASTRLHDLLGSDLVSQARKGIIEQDGRMNVVLQPLGAQDIYYEFAADAAVASSVKIASGSSVTLQTESLSKIYLIAAVENADVRVSVS